MHRMICGMLSRLAVFVLSIVLAAAAALQAQMLQPRIRAFSFRDQKPVFGVPAGKVNVVGCTPSGTEFITVGTPLEELGLGPMTGEPLSGMYRVPRDGNALAFPGPQPPPEYRDATKVSDFVNDHDFVRLYLAEKSDPDTGRVLEKRYFVSRQPIEGTNADIVPLEVKFRPLSIAMFDGGDYLVLGWDEVNLIPELAFIKPNGVVRRFLDLDNRAASASTMDPVTMRGAAARPSVETLKLLEHARFTAFGGAVILQQVQGTGPLHVLTSAGDDRVVPLAYPPNMVLHDVLPSPETWTMMVRYESQPSKDDAKDTPVRERIQRIFEVDSQHGSLLNEFTFDTPAVKDVSCAPARRLSGVYFAPDPSASVTTGPDGKPVKPPMRLIVGAAAH